MKSIILLSLIGFTSFGFSQSNEETSLLKFKVIHLVNNLRDSLGLHPLQTDSILENAAFKHAQYMSKYDVLEHEQKFPKTKTPSKRVQFEGGNDFELVGENIQFQKVDKLPKNKKVDALGVR